MTTLFKTHKVCGNLLEPVEPCITELWESGTPNASMRFISLPRVILGNIRAEAMEHSSGMSRNMRISWYVKPNVVNAKNCWIEKQVLNKDLFSGGKK